MNVLWREMFDGSVMKSSSCIDFCRENETIVLACLPVILSELAGLSDFNEVFKLVDKCGGRKIYLPKSAKDFSTISGVDLDESTYQHWRRLARINGQIEISSKWGVFLSLRRAAIHQALQAGIQDEDIILDFGITQRQLRSLRVKFNYPREQYSHAINAGI